MVKGFSILHVLQILVVISTANNYTDNPIRTDTVRAIPIANLTVVRRDNRKILRASIVKAERLLIACCKNPSAKRMVQIETIHSLRLLTDQTRYESHYRMTMFADCSTWIASFQDYNRCYTLAAFIRFSFDEW